MEILNEYSWVVIILMLGWICYRLWKRGKYRKPDQENTYFSLTKTAPYACPFDIEGRSCKDPNCPDGMIDCKNCTWYNNGVRPSKF